MSRNNNTIAVKQQDFIKEHEIKDLLVELHTYNILIYEPKINNYSVRLLSPRFDVNKISNKKL